MPTKRWMVVAGIVIFAGFAGATQIFGHRLTEEEVFIREFPDALIYKGVGAFRLGDYRGAVEAWEQYVKLAPRGADTTSVRELIAEARKAAKK